MGASTVAGATRTLPIRNSLGNRMSNHFSGSAVET
jgi:hypothetical protein